MRAVEYGEPVGEVDIAYDLLLDSIKNGDVVEVKYWRESTVRSNMGKLVDQVREYTSQGRKVILEMGTTKGNPVTKETIKVIEQTLIEEGIPKSLFEVKLIP